MRHLRWLLAGLALLLTAALVTHAELSPTNAPTTSRLQSAAISRLPMPPPKAKFIRATYVSTRLAESAKWLDACRGPIAIQLSGDRPVLVAEHDHCGGSAWVSRLEAGDAVKLSGNGVVPATYIVTEIRRVLQDEAKVRDLPATDVVLQTCVGKRSVVLVGVERFDPYAVA